FSKGYFGFDILGAIPFHRPTKWVQYTSIYSRVGLFSICLLVFMPETDSLKHPQQFYLTLLFPQTVFIFNVNFTNIA
ncbi:hypothetical protein OSK02_22570, partial [Escherichia coli]|nr:hypothetical protein [Escherichia coli]MDA6145973.1 hypothetical protein [Escherichia coli]